VAVAGADGSEAGLDGALDGTLRPDDRRGKEVRRFEHPGPGRLERGARARELGKAVQQLKRESGGGLFVGGVKLPLALTELGLIDEYEFVVHPRLAGHGPTLFAGLCRHEARQPAGVRLRGGGDALRAEKKAVGLRLHIVSVMRLVWR
jgi:hypothetical protein